MTLKLPPKYIISQLLHSHSVSSVGDQQRAVQHNRSVSCSSLFESLDQVSFSKQTRLQLQSCNSVPIPKDSSVTNPRWHQVTHRTATSHCFFLTVISPDVQFSNLIFLFFTTTSVRFSDTEAQYSELDHKIKGRKL